MTISKKGMRAIIVDHQKYYWKFDEIIFISADSFKKCFLTIDFGWFDKWLYVQNRENEPPGFEPKTVTPKFIADSIKFAKSEGWNEEKMELEFKNGSFKRKI